jgi:hypothetical protein
MRAVLGRFLLIAAAAVAFVPSPTVLAQPAAALGKPLPDSGMAAGSVSVRVVAGSPANAVPGADVTLMVNDQPHVARTDASGRAVFTSLTAGATVRAKIKDAEGKDVISDPFPVPSAGGARVMLTTKPFGASGGGMGAGPMQGGQGGQGMPEPRKLSGQPRPDPQTTPGTYVVRLTYNDLGAKPGTPEGPPADTLVSLVGYAADESVVVLQGKTDVNGRVEFKDLDMTGTIGYFALATLPRGTGVDRLFSMPIQLDGQAGIRTILSGDKRDAGTPNIDQYASQQAVQTPPNKVRVTLDGLAAPGIPVKLVDATTKQVVAQVPAGSMSGDPSTVQGGSKFDAKADVPANTVDVFVHGGIGGADGPLGDIEIHVIPSDAQGLDGSTPFKTGADGKVQVKATIPEGKQARAVFKILGRDFVSEAFDISKTGGAVDITAKWAEGGRPQALFDVPHKPGQVLYAEAAVTGKLEGNYRSMPFLTTEQTGVHVGVIVYPRVMVKFNMRAMIEDKLLAVQGRFTVENNSWMPYRASADGMLLPMPKGFKGGVIADMNQNDVAVVPGEGFRILRPLPPGSGRVFVGGFSLEAEDGVVEWSLDLPLGTVGSEIGIRQTANMKVDLPEGAKGGPVEMKDGSTYFQIDDIKIARGKAMVMTIRGLPSVPAWKVWAPRIVGVFVVLMILGGVALAMFAKRAKAPVAQTLARKHALLEELVELERSGADQRRREQLIAELEKLWGAG